MCRNPTCQNYPGRYWDFTNGDVKLVACTNAGCTGPQTPVTLDSGRCTSIAIGTNGNPVISYHDLTNQDLTVVACGNPTCQNYRGRNR